MPAVALTDQCNLFAMVKFYRAALERGVQPIIGVGSAAARAGGARRPLAPDAAVPEPRRLPQSVRAGQSRRILRVRASAAMALIERAWLDPDSTARTDRALGRARRGHRPGAAARARARRPSRRSSTGSRCSAIASISSCSALGRPEEQTYLPAALALAARRGVPVVATNDVRFLTARGLRGARGAGVHSRGCAARRCGAPAPLHAAAVPAQRRRRCARCSPISRGAATTACEIARRCSLALKLGQPRLPDYPVPGGAPPR